MNGPGSYRCCGVRVDGYGPMAAVAALLESRFGEARGAHLCNSYTLALAVRNLFNRVNLSTPVGNLSSPLFGESTSLSGGFGPMGASAASNRRLDLQLRFSF